MAYAAAYTPLPTPQAAREEESLVFRLAARRLRDAADRKARNAALGINHEIWSHMFRDLNAAENRLPPILKQDCLTLARWSLDYSTRALLKDLPLQPLIDINEQVADGLAAPAAAGASSGVTWMPAMA
ncbi:flagellar biosynthesis regulator FlaF [Lichenicoccus sp.]|uniref:flagellar biosynthesis regulator FlaF n=1 Tax=Lichenicoccus sp. TaxID=2781899 RepID=UPI003D0B6C5F